MTVDNPGGSGLTAVPTPDEVAAIVAVLQSLEEPAAPPPPARSRWREAARRFESDSL